MFQMLSAVSLGELNPTHLGSRLCKPSAARKISALCVQEQWMHVGEEVAPSPALSFHGRADGTPNSKRSPPSDGAAGSDRAIQSVLLEFLQINIKICILCTQSVVLYLKSQCSDSLMVQFQT